MRNVDTQTLIAADKAHTWHPFTQMQEWSAAEHDPLVIVEGRGTLLRDSEGREYIDGNSSIWTNLHGHNHPRLNTALRAQLDRVAHTSFLGFTHPGGATLAKELVALWPADTLTRVFFSDDGSTAVEVAIKQAVQYHQLTGHPERELFIAFSDAYHGDTMGASSLGGVSTFSGRFSSHQFPVHRVQSAEELESIPHEYLSRIAAVIIEPLIQGAAGMKIWPAGTLRSIREWCDAQGVLLIADEVMTGFGRTGTMFACEQEQVVPDFIALAKGLTGGYFPMAATLTTERVFEAFLGSYEDRKTFFYGHSYTANPLGCALALENLRIFRDENVLEMLEAKIARFVAGLETLSATPHVWEIRRCGFVAGVELRQDAATQFDWRRQTGARVCNAARRHGLLTRPIGDTIVLMPPYCISDAEMTRLISALDAAIRQVTA